MISKLYTLRFVAAKDYEKNLKRLQKALFNAEKGAFIVAPEVCLSDYDYDDFDAACDFTPYAIEQLLPLTKNKTIIFTAFNKEHNGVYNTAFVLHNGSVIHKQHKAKLFKFGDEHRYFDTGKEEDIALFEIEGVKIGVLICFELRFKSIWKRLECADIIAVPARWGKIRAQNFISLTNALGIVNQCYVAASDAAGEEFSGKSGIVTPFGEERRNGNRFALSLDFSKREIAKMRRYMDVEMACRT